MIFIGRFSPLAAAGAFLGTPALSRRRQLLYDFFDEAGPAATGLRIATLADTISSTGRVVAPLCLSRPSSCDASLLIGTRCCHISSLRYRHPQAQEARAAGLAAVAAPAGDDMAWGMIACRAPQHTARGDGASLP